MVDQAQVEFYNEIYRAKPRMWSSVDRDYLAFKIVSQHLEDEPDTMLDIGCGNGHTIAFFHAQWPDTEYTGVDISDVALELAKKRVPDGKFYEDMRLGRYDVITIMGTAEHFEDPAAELHYIASHMSLNTLLYLECPNCLAYSPDKTEGFRKTHAGSDQSEWHWLRSTWEQATRDAGLEIVKGYKGALPEAEFIWVLKRC